MEIRRGPLDSSFESVQFEVEGYQNVTIDRVVKTGTVFLYIGHDWVAFQREEWAAFLREVSRDADEV